MIHTKQEIAHMAIDEALHAKVSPAMVCAIIEVSSGWNPGIQEWEPEPWLLSNHPFDFAGGLEEYTALATRWGLMQFHASDLRRFKWPGKYSAQLGEPRNNLAAGCWLLREITGTSTDPKPILLKWYGFARRSMVNLTLGLLPRFEEFVAARPSRTAVAG